MTTLTFRVAAVQTKILHLQFRMVKVHEDNELIFKELNEAKTNREKVLIGNKSFYGMIDKLITIEKMQQLVGDIFNTPEIKNELKNEPHVQQMLSDVRSVAMKWKHVRNKIAGHIDIEMVEEMCSINNFKGVFLSIDLERDVVLLNWLLLQTAINTTRNKSDIFGRNIDLNKNNQAEEMKLVAETLTKDWNHIFGYFGPFHEFLYRIGKQEKLNNTSPYERLGLIRD